MTLPKGVHLLKKDLREDLAALCHEQWSGWMKYLWSKSDIYSEKDADRAEADRILDILKATLAQEKSAREEAEKCLAEHRYGACAQGKRAEEAENRAAMLADVLESLLPRLRGELYSDHPELVRAEEALKAIFPARASWLGKIRAQVWREAAKVCELENLSPQNLGEVFEAKAQEESSK